jgi:GntR family transcriptional regulator
MPTPRDPRPRSQQIAAELRADIMAGELVPGEQLPSNALLRDRYGVTNATVQHALAILKAEGFVYGHAGKGVFVGPVPMHTITPSDYAKPAEPGEQYRWTTEATTRGEVGKAELLEVGEVPASAEVARAFGVERGSPVVRRYQLLTLDDEPAELVNLYFPVEWARGTALTRTRKIAGGTPSLLAGMGREAVLFEDSLSARPATTEEYVRLDLPSEVPVLRTFRICMTADQHPVQCEVLVKAGNRRNIRYRWHGGV